MTTPAVVELQPVDLSLEAGSNEAERPELLDWTKSMTTIQNMVLSGKKALVKRPGVNYAIGVYDTDSHVLPTPMRALPYSNAAAFAGLGTDATGELFVQMYHLNEATGGMVCKGKLPEFSVVNTPIASSQSELGSPASVVGVEHTGAYVVMATTVNGGLRPYVSLYVMDLDGNQVLKRWDFRGNCQLVKVDNNTIHVYTDEGNLFGGTFLAVLDLITMTLGTFNNVAGILENMVRAGKCLTGSFLLTTQNLSTYDAAGTLVGTIAQNAPQDADSNDAGNIFVLDLNVGFLDILGFDSSCVATTTYATGVASTGGDRIAVHPTLAQGRVVAKRSSTPAAPSAPALTVLEVYSTDLTAAITSLGNIPCWVEAASPAYNSTTGRCYMALTKERYSQVGTTFTDDKLGRTVLVDLTEEIHTDADNTRFRPTAVLGGFTTVVPAGMKPRIRELSGELVVGYTSKNTAGSYTHSVARLTYIDARYMTCTSEGYISGGFGSSYGGGRVEELAFLDSPNLFVYENGAGSCEAGTRTYVASYEVVDASGRVHYSQMSPTCQLTVAASKTVTMQVTLPSLTCRTDLGTGKIMVSIWATVAGGQELHLVQRTSVADTGAYSQVMFTSMNHNLTDVALLARDVCYRQLVGGAPLDRHPPPASRHVVQHKDRTFWACGSNVYYSSYLVDGEAAWTNPAFVIFVPGGTGEITGLASMDGQLVIFKKDGIWVVDGDGPPENGGTGTEFSPPRRILTEFGCNESRSLVAMPDGVMYRSERGIELLARGLQVIYIGEKVKDTVAANPYMTGATFDRKNGRVLFTLGTVLQYTGGVLSYAYDGAIVCFDTVNGAWTTWKCLTVGTARYGAPLQDVCFVNVQGVDKVMALEPLYYVDFFNDAANDSTDYGTFIPFVLETGWVKMKSNQDRIRVSDFLVLGKWKSNHNLKVSCAYDYSGTYSYTKTFTPADIVLAGGIEQLELQVPKQAVQAIRFKVEDEVPADTTTYPVTTGKSLEVLGLTVKLGLRGGGAKLPASNKG